MVDKGPRAPESRSLRASRSSTSDADRGRASENATGPLIGEQPASLPVDAFDDLWEAFRSIRTRTSGSGGLLARVDPVVFLIRQRILEDTLKGLLLKSSGIRGLSMDHKKLLARRFSNGVWKGYLMGLAVQEVGRMPAPARAMMDFKYLWSVFNGLLKGYQESFAGTGLRSGVGKPAGKGSGKAAAGTDFPGPGLPGGSLAGAGALCALPDLDPPVARALAELQRRETEKLEDELGAAGAGPVVTADGSLLFAATGGLVLMGFLVWKAQRKALGLE